MWVREGRVHSFASTESEQGGIGVALALVIVGQGSNSPNAVGRMSAKLQTEEGKKGYAKRKEIAELVAEMVRKEVKVGL